MDMIGRRSLLATLAAMPVLAPALLRAQNIGRIAVAPIQVRDDRVWLPVRFGAGDSLPFVLDTGAFANLIRRDVVAQLDLRQVGSQRLRGVGSEVLRYPFYRADDVAIGDVRVGQLIFGAIQDLQIHPEARGALSAGLLTAADSDLDFDSGLWRLHLDGRSDRNGFEALPSEIDSLGPGFGARKMRLTVQLDGESYRLEIDTGSPSDISLFPQGTRRSRKWNDSTPFAPHRRRGLGGDGGSARLVRAQEASVGGIRFTRPLVSLSNPAESLDFNEIDGLLGIGLIQRMNLSTDLRARKVWARRNRQRARPERYGLSGLWLVARGDGAVVDVIGIGSPAAAAGLRPGDRLEGGTLAEWIERLGGRPGASIEIPFRRDGAAQSVTITLREYL